MKLDIPTDRLRKALRMAVMAVPGRADLPVLSNLLVEVKRRALTLATTDIDTAIRIRVRDAKVEESGAITVPARRLLAIVKELPDRIITLRTEKHSLVLAAGEEQYHLLGLEADEFPTLPTVPFKEGWTLPGTTLGELIGRTAFAASTEESRPILNRVLVQGNGNRVKLVATDGYRLTIAAANGVAATDQELIVASPVLQLLQKVLRGWEEGVSGARDGNHIGFKIGDVEVYGLVIDGSYPAYDQVIPKNCDRTAVVDRTPLIGLLKRVLPIASDQTRRVRFHFSEVGLQVSVFTPDLGKAEGLLEIEYEGEELEIGFNIKYLLEALTHMPASRIRMQLKAPERAVVIEPVAEDGREAPDYMSLVMPLRLLD